LCAIPDGYGMRDPGNRGPYYAGGELRRICGNCQHWKWDGRPKSGWGNCDIAERRLYLHRPRWKPDGYMAFHSTARYWNNAGCRTDRFIPVERKENED